MLRRLSIEGYKSFAATEVAFRPLTVIVGPNGSGKSNLFDAIRLLARFACERTLHAAFERHRGTPLEAFHRAGRPTEELLREKRLRMRLEADVELSASTIGRVTAHVQAARDRAPPRSVVPHRLLRYAVAAELLTESGRLRVRDERLDALRRDGSPKASRNAFLEREGQRLHLRREGGGHPYYHELGLDHTVISEPLYPPHFPHATALKEELARWRFHVFQASSARAVAAIGTADSDERGAGSVAGFLHRVASEHPDELARLTERLARLVPFVEGLQVEADSEGTLQLRIVEQGVPLSARVAASGTLRILALLAAISPHSGATLVACEDPEAGVHPRRFGELVRLLREAADSGLQILVNTHSATFARLFANEHLLVCERDGWETRFGHLDSSVEGLFRDAAIEEALNEEPTQRPY